MIKKASLILLILLFIATQVLLPLTIVNNKNIQKIYKITKIKEIPTEKRQFSTEIWNIKIPNINLIAPIKDGTEVDILNKYVGHFTDSGYILGNISLAAHNRGYPVNYFKDLKKLKIGDEIIYEYKDLKMTYKINQIRIIQDTDVEVVENTKENKITLITCTVPKGGRIAESVVKYSS